MKVTPVGGLFFEGIGLLALLWWLLVASLGVVLHARPVLQVILVVGGLLLAAPLVVIAWLRRAQLAPTGSSTNLTAASSYVAGVSVLVIDLLLAWLLCVRHSAYASGVGMAILVGLGVLALLAVGYLVRVRRMTAGART